MDELYKMLRAYNLDHRQEQQFVPWSKMYIKSQFPKYWKIVFEILSKLEKELKIVEIGCGLGDVTAILCYLGYSDVISFEKDKQIAELAQIKIKELFGIDNVIRNITYPTEEILNSDLLIMVNCAYKDHVSSKQEYIDLIKCYYEYAGSPKYFIMEVIDSSYNLIDDEFPEYIRLSRDDVNGIFPYADIKEWKTYVYPENSKSKKLYHISKS